MTKMRPRLILVGLLALALALAACGTPEPTPPAGESYGDCVAKITMDPDDAQKYIDEVKEKCGEP